MRPLYIVVEITARELEAKALLAALAASKGMEVYIGHEDMIRRLAFLRPSGVFFDKSLHTDYPKLFRRLRRLGHVVAACDEEALVMDEAQYLPFYAPEEVEEGVDLFFAWGEAHRDLYCIQRPRLCAKTIPLGNARMDLLRTQMRPFHQGRVEVLRRRLGPFVLINSRFGFSNNAMGREQKRRMIMEGGAGADIQRSLAEFDFEWSLLQEFLTMAVALCERYPGRLFVVRPHPSEDFALWEEAARGRDNLLVERSGNVHQWILASDLVIQNGCTTAVEALLLETPCISYRPVTSSEFDFALTCNTSVNAFSLGELYALLDGGLKRIVKEQRPRWLEVVRRHVGSVEGPLATERMTDSFLKWAKFKRVPERPASLMIRADAHFRSLNRLAKARLREITGKPKLVDPRGKWVTMDEENLRELIRSFSFYDPGFNDLDVQRVYPDCFRLRSRKA